MAREYKNSGISWVGKIPNDWKVIRNKNVFSCEKKIIGMQSSNAQLLSLTTKGIKAISLGDTTGKVPESYDTYQIVDKDNLVMCLFDLDCSAVFAGISKYKGMISPAYKVLSCKSNMLPRYANYWFMYVFDGRKFKHYSKNIRYSLTYEEFGGLKILNPTNSEQQIIADYLDKKCGEIDELIDVQEQMIQKLTDYKQSVITEIVTKGLNPNVRIVPSGIDWIGDVPERWAITDMKNLCISITDGSHFSPEIQSEGMPYITASDVRGKGIDYNNAMRIKSEDYNMLVSQGCRPHKGDVLMVKDGATTGRVGMMTDDEECVLLSSVAMLTPLPNVDSDYLMCLIQSDVIQTQIRLLMAGSAMPRVTLKKINTLKGLLIPTDEQQAIASCLVEKCFEIDSLIALKQQKIEKLKDYKKSVIYEAVTGKLDLS